MTGYLKSPAQFEGVMLDKLPDWQLGWLAGMIDGEGTITITSKGKPLVSISSTTPIGEILQWMTGMGVISTASLVDRENCKPTYQWTVNPVAAVYKLLSTLSSYILIKRRQCDLMLKYCKERLAENLYANPISREDYIEEIQELNKRGPQEEVKE